MTENLEQKAYLARPALLACAMVCNLTLHHSKLHDDEKYKISH